MATEQATVLRLTRKFDAPRERVFDAWIDSELLMKWWAAMPKFEPSLAEVDAREGGRYRLGMRDTESGDVHIVGGEYREVRRPERLVYTWTGEGGAKEMEGSAETLVEVDFVEDGGGTEVVLTHSGFENEQIRDMHTHGWNGCLDSLERLLS
jgi:uncharacterized protein YndB with AHSA1/START domain